MNLWQNRSLKQKPNIVHCSVMIISAETLEIIKFFYITVIWTVDGNLPALKYRQNMYVSLVTTTHAVTSNVALPKHHIADARDF